MKKNKPTAFILALAAAANILYANTCTNVWAADPPKAQSAQKSRSGNSLSESDMRAVSEVISEHTFGYGVYILSYDTKKNIIEIAVESKKQIPQVKKAFADRGVSRKTLSKKIKFTVTPVYADIAGDLDEFGLIVDESSEVIRTEYAEQYEYENGMFTGETGEPVVYTKNLSDISLTELYPEGSETPKDIYIPLWYRLSNTKYFEFKDTEAYIEKYSEGRWIRLRQDSEWDNISEALVGRGFIITDDPEHNDEPMEDGFIISTYRFSSQMTPGKYRGVIGIRATSSGIVAGYSDTDIYSYFTITE